MDSARYDLHQTWSLVESVHIFTGQQLGKHAIEYQPDLDWRVLFIPQTALNPSKCPKERRQLSMLFTNFLIPSTLPEVLDNDIIYSAVITPIISKMKENNWNQIAL